MQLQSLTSQTRLYSHNPHLNSTHTRPRHSLKHINHQYKTINKHNTKLISNNLHHFTHNNKLTRTHLLTQINIMVIKHTSIKTKDENVPTLGFYNLILVMDTNNNISNTGKLKSLALNLYSTRLLKHSTLL